jgi:predicted MFS family arabinose efflux permease
MLPRLDPANRTALVIALGTAQTIAWGSSYYLPAVLATPMARDLGVSPVWIFGAFSLAMIVSALVGPWGGKRIDRLGGREVLMGANGMFAAGLVLMAASQHVGVMLAAWVLIGLAMGVGLYESAFAALAGIYRQAARSPITGITLIAGFASTVAWPLSGFLDATIGWRGACLVWAAIHLLVALPLNALLPRPAPKPEAGAPAATGEPEPAEPPPQGRLAMALLAFVFAATWFSSTAMAAHLPRLLEAAGATTAVAIAAGALIGPAQVAARIAEYGLLQRFHPLISARIAAATHPIGAAVLMSFGAPAAYAFTLLHGAGNGVLTIAKGTLPLVIFGPTGYGHRQGLLNAPARVLQAFAPLIFGFALERWGAGAVWLTAGISLAACVALFVLRAKPPER